MLRFQNIDEINRDDHYHLTPKDRCIFLWEYTSGQDYKYGETNSLISNLKKSPSRKGRPEWRYKVTAMRKCAEALGAALNEDWLKIAVLVPVPSSKAIGDPEYDDRMVQICRSIRRGSTSASVREIVVQRMSMEAAHISGARPSPDELVANYDVVEPLCEPLPQCIGIVDDVLTAGAHYRAMHTVLSRRFPSVPIIGIFIARRIFPERSSAEEFSVEPP